MSSEHIRILSLEDSPFDAELIERELRRAKMQFSMTRVENEGDFRQQLDSSNPDVILADYNLPQFDGISALKIARVIVPDTPFIFVSGSIGEERAVQALREGAVDYVIKDRLARLPAAITRAIVERRERLLRQHAQEALIESEERFQHAARATQEVIWDWNLETDKVWFSEALATLWGYSLPGDEVDVDWWAERIHPDEREAIIASISEALASGQERWSGEYRFQRANGSYGHVLDRAIIVRNGGPRPKRLICAMLDVTQQARAAEQLRESELRFRSVAETATDGIMVINSRAEIVFWNTGAAQMFGYPHHEILGKSVRTLVAEYEVPAQRALLDRYFSQGARPPRGEIVRRTCVTRDGVEFPVELSVAAWQAYGQTFMTAILRDVTAQVEDDKRRQVQMRVAETLAEATTVAEAINGVLPSIAEPFGWRAGIYWHAEENGTDLTCVSTWRAEGAEDDNSLDAALTASLAAGSHLTSEVLKSGDAKQTFGTSTPFDTSEAPLHQHRIALPIAQRDRICGVLEFFYAGQQIDDGVLSVLQEIGKRIGDFAERRAVEENLLRSEASLAEAQQIAHIGSWSYDCDSRSIEWSVETKRIFRLDEDEKLDYRRFLDLIHSDDREAVRQLTTPPYRSETTEFQHRIVTAGGETRIVHCRLRIVDGTPADPRKIVGTIQDVTDQIEAENTIARLSRQNELILKHAAEGIFGIDLDGKVTFLNPAAARITGWSEEEFLEASSIGDLINAARPAGAADVQDEFPIRQTLRDGVIRSTPGVFWKKSGEPVQLQLSISPIYEGERITGCVVVFQDIGERLQLEKQLEQTRRISTLGRVAATIAHEFNNVLMGIQPFAEVIRRRADGDEKVAKAASQILSSVTRGKRVTQEILRFTQPAEPAMQPVNIADWLRQLVPELRAMTGQRVEIALELPDDDLMVQCDTPQMQQVFTNLVLNARDAMPAGGTVTISARAVRGEQQLPFGNVAAGMAVLTVEDTGTGMPPEVAQNVFEPLFTTKRSGTGLGLAVAQQVVSRHGGTIHVESRPNVGTRFYIVLPTTAVLMAPAQDAVRTPLHLTRVLLVEDEPAVAAGIVTLLELEGIDVAVVEHGTDAMTAAATFRPDAVILDLSLSDMPGTEVFERLISRWPDLPVIFSTGHGDEQTLESYLTAPHVGFLRKPYEFDALASMLQKVTESRKGTEALQQ